MTTERVRDSADSSYFAPSRLGMGPGERMPDATAAVTIILPFRNAQEYLSETLQSVKAQSFPCWHLVLVDDGSTDSSLAVAQRFADELKGKVSILRLSGGGVAAARNHAVAHVKTRYVAFLDADDVWTKDKLETQLNAMKSHGAAFSYTAFRKLDAASSIGSTVFYVPEAIAYERLLAGNPIRCFTVMYDQHKLGPVFMPDIKMRNDLLAWLVVLDKLRKRVNPSQDIVPGALEPAGANPVLGINTVLGYYRQYSTSLTGNKLTAAKYQWIAYREYLGMSIPRAIGYYLRYAINGLISYSK
jgi:teichuronic acid biosynthesis glycosyltransferase TuaG